MKSSFDVLWAAFLQKFCPANDKEHLFVNYLEKALEEHHEKWSSNKKEHLDQQKQIAKRSFWAVLTGSGNLKSPLTIYPIVSFVFMLITFGVGLFAINNTLYQIMIGIIFVVLTIVLFLFAMRTNYSVYKKTQELLLKKPCETWVRHCCAYNLLEQEVRKFTFGIVPYTGRISLENQKEIFCKNIEDLYSKNLEQFKENMKSKEEVVL